MVRGKRLWPETGHQESETGNRKDFAHVVDHVAVRIDETEIYDCNQAENRSRRDISHGRRIADQNFRSGQCQQHDWNQQEEKFYCHQNADGNSGGIVIADIIPVPWSQKLDGQTREQIPDGFVDIQIEAAIYRNKQ